MDGRTKEDIVTPRQRQSFIDGLNANRIDNKEHHGGEISILCPSCAPDHPGNKRHTLSINSNNDRWNCYRCPTLKGRKKQISRLLDILKLGHLLSVFDEEEVLVEDDSLAKLKRRMIFGVPEIRIMEVSPLVLPDGYRTDWNGSMIGESLLKYLTVNRNLSLEDIARYKIGYSLDGSHAGGVVFPVYLNKKLRFWQVRRVIMRGNAPKYDSPKAGRRSVMFGYDEITTKSVNIVEGIFDKIAIGDGTVALLSKDISEEQIGLLGAKSIETVRVILDGDAWKDCKQLARTIANKLWSAKLVLAHRLKFGVDPGMLGRDTMNSIVETVTIRN